MGKLHKSLKKISPIYQLDRDTFDQMHPLGTQMETAYDAQQAAEKALKEAQDQPVIPAPDEEELARSRRRNNAKRRGSTASNVPDSDRLGG